MICRCFTCIDRIVCGCIENCYCRFFISTTDESKRGEIFELFRWRHLVKFKTWTSTFRSYLIIIETTSSKANQRYNSRSSEYMRERTEMKGDHNRRASMLLSALWSIVLTEWSPLSREKQFIVKKFDIMACASELFSFSSNVSFRIHELEITK